MFDWAQRCTCVFSPIIALKNPHFPQKKLDGPPFYSSHDEVEDDNGDDNVDISGGDHGDHGDDNYDDDGDHNDDDNDVVMAMVTMITMFLSDPMGTDLTLAFLLSISRLFFFCFHIQTLLFHIQTLLFHIQTLLFHIQTLRKRRVWIWKSQFFSISRLFGKEESGYGKEILFLQTLSDSKLTQPLPEAQFVLLSPLAVI